MASHNNQMTELLDRMSSLLTEKITELMPEMAGSERAKLEDLLMAYEEDVADYRELLDTDQATASLTDVVAVQRLYQRISQADAADIVDLVGEFLEFIEDKFAGAGFANRSTGIAAGGASLLMVDDDDLLGLGDEWEDDDDDMDADFMGDDYFSDDDDY
jgi:class 3 adenylate cyclase